ncbi:hypothetical protein [Corallococcus sp. 4LFB]|uniref:hypothetical protein n=1 Tax=Corallococcus sp. 4LFB TaxID=3383249 RepID=UPI003975BC1D
MPGTLPRSFPSFPASFTGDIRKAFTAARTELSEAMSSPAPATVSTTSAREGSSFSMPAPNAASFTW